jgi:serine/threonine-protein kinase
MAGLIGQMLDQYHLVEQIGQGGMATVYRALDTRRGDEVAIKVLLPTITGDRRFIKRFRREAGLVKRMDHPNIVPVEDYGESQGYVYLVMPFVEGETLLDRMINQGVTEVEAGKWIGEVADALSFAHQNGVIHRDIKPSNIMIDHTEKAMLSDFGLARFVEGTNTLTGSMLMGTPAYVSPEQGKGLKLDERSDQYSLGVVLYQLSTGKLPFDSEAPMALVLMHIQEPVPKPSRFNRKLSPAVEKVILKSLAKDPAHRFKNVSELKKAYRAALAGDPIEWVKLPSPPAHKVPVIPLSYDSAPFRNEPPSKRRLPNWVLMLIAVPLIFGAGIIGLNVLGNLDSAEGGIEPIPMVTQMVATVPMLIPTDTSIPPTMTPAVSVNCPGLRLFSFDKSGNEVAWKLDNGSESLQRVVDLKLIFPIDNPVERVRLGSELLIDAADAELESSQSGTVVTGEAATLEENSVTDLVLQFKWGDDLPGYSLELMFDSGCSLKTEW